MRTTVNGVARHHEDILRFVERFALILTESGIRRMEARVFAYALTDDAERHTAGEFATGLRVSPAAISGAVRHLVQIGLLDREREPGSRVDTFRVHDDDVWYSISKRQAENLGRAESVLSEGVELLDQARPGGRRIRETLEYYRFIHSELPQTMERWRRHRGTLSAASTTSPPSTK